MSEVALRISTGEMTLAQTATNLLLVSIPHWVDTINRDVGKVTEHRLAE